MSPADGPPGAIIARSTRARPEVRDLLGHCHLGVTSRYAHLGWSEFWQAVERLAVLGQKPAVIRIANATDARNPLKEEIAPGGAAGLQTR